MNDRICTIIGNVGYVECLQLTASFPLVELRLDLLSLDFEKIETLARRCRQWVATCREGKYTERERTVQLSTAIRAGATYVDIEYETRDEYREPLVDLARKCGSQVILSFHDFEKTPALPEMLHIIEQSREKGADWVKIAVTAHSAADAARVMSLYEHHQRIIAFAMGDAGRITRIAAPFLGAPFTFAAIDKKHATAPGQFTTQQMRKMLI
ncbi:MAG: type I 3-dehydroquinate dehydratase [Bacteroidales bacterium]|jgi:3-dehydroquinate dehydratase type I|nr:type I 3-dehydroquinate dehydratase [Bacteroidales bacterium]